MTQSGLSTIWTRCVDRSPSLIRYSTQRRFSTFSNLPASLPGSVCANSEACAARCRSSQHLARSHLTTCIWIPNRLHLEVLAMYTVGLLVVQEFVSNASGSPYSKYSMTRGRSPRFIIDFVVFPTPMAHGSTGLLPRGCDVETHGTSERRSSPGNHHLPAVPADFELDVRWRSIGIHQEEP